MTAEELAEQLIGQGQEYQGAGRFTEAVESYLQAFKLAPKDARLPWEAGRLYLYFLNQPADAVRWFEASLPLLDDPIMACDTRYHLGLAHSFLQQDDRAAVRFEEALAQTPSHVLSCIELGKLLTRKGDHERARDLLQQAVLHNNMRSTMPEMFPDGVPGSAHADALAWINLGRLALVASDDEELGLKAVVHLLDERDDDQRVMKLAEEARAAGKPNAAMIALHELLGRQPDHEAATDLWFAVALDDLKQVDDVVDMAESMLEDDPERSARMVAEILARDPGHKQALALRAALKD